MTEVTLKARLARATDKARGMAEVILSWIDPKAEGRPVHVMGSFQGLNDRRLQDAGDAGFVRIWIDEYDGLYRACLTPEGQDKRCELETTGRRKA